MKKIIITAVGMLSIGYLLGKKVNRKKYEYAGTLRIDNSEMDEPAKLFLELEKDISVISNAKVINLKVLKKNYI